MYDIKKKIENGKHIFTISVNIPQLMITKNLNFRIKSLTFLDGRITNDPNIKNSNHIFEVKKHQLGKTESFNFEFESSEIQNVKLITIGFCDELVQWYAKTLRDIEINKQTPQENVSANIISKKDASIKIDKDKKVCMLSTWEMKCGISQYCKNLHDSLIKEKFSVRVFENSQSYYNVFNFIRKDMSSIFIVQYEPSIISNFNLLRENIIRLKRQNYLIKVYFTIHSENQDLLKLDGIIDGFIYHKKNEIQYSKSKVHIIPMGVPIFEPEVTKELYREKYNIKQDSLVISTVGFMFGWKKHADVLEKLVPLIKSDSRIIIQLMTSFHSINNGECIVEFNKIQNIIKENNIGNQVIHITDYIDQKELSGRLFASDLGYLWSGIETTSSSASLKEFVASRLPVVKTNSTHYHDIVTGCITTEQDLNVFGDAIANAIFDNKRLKLLSDEMNVTYGTMNYNNTILKFLEVFNS